MRSLKLLLFTFLSLDIWVLGMEFPNLISAQVGCGQWKSQCCTGSLQPACGLGLSCQAGICESTGTTSQSGSAVAFPGNGNKIPCDKTANPEFNSDRPYQASPCGDSNKAYFCSNSVVITLGTVSMKYPGPGPHACEGNCSGHVDKIIVDLTNVQLPVLGNTQQVKNGVNSTSSIDNATLMNNYVSSYLNGTTNQAEDTAVNSTDVINFSGPIKKLLPQQIQEAQRIATIKTPITTTSSEPNDSGQTQTDTLNHNQIVVCGKKEYSLPSWLTLLPTLLHLGSIGIGREIPVDCYSGNGSSISGNIDVYRLSNVDTHDNNWAGSNTAQDIINWATQNLSKIYPTNIVAQVLVNAADRWSLKIPPLPWADQKGKPFTSDIAYQKAYNEWRGKLCGIVASHLFCLDGWPFISNPYADLFPYIPLANTTDKASAQTINSVEIQASNGTMDSSGTNYVLGKSPNLYFPHTQESADLSSLLQMTFKTKNQKGQTIPDDVQNNATCQTVNSYSNPGDDVAFTMPKSYLEVDNLNYKVSQINCPDIKKTQHCEPDPNNPRGPELCTDTTPNCSTDIYATIPMQNKTPNLNEIWDNTVAGDQSIFRRIYPQTGVDSPIECIADSPGSSGVTYTSDAGPNITRVIEPDQSKVGGGTGGSNTIAAQMYFPHLGGIEQYFLQGIQTALRPQGYGETVTSNACIQQSVPSGVDVCSVAKKYNIPCCQLKGVEELETGGGTNTGTGSCATNHGTFACCHGSVCGPAQVACTQYNDFAGKDKINMCDPAGGAELLARAMLLKLCQADHVCDSYDWTKWGDYVTKHYKIKDGDYTATAYFYGLQNGCYASACTQYRWGAGKGYCDSVKAYCDTGKVLPDNTTPSFCSACNIELERAHQQPISCP